MTALQYIYTYVLTIPVFVALDLLWLGVIAKDYYGKNLQTLLGPVQWTPAIFFYLIYVAGILIFVVSPALANDSLRYAMLYGALFGFIAYATYDLTNLATLKGWPVQMSIVDMFWGAFLTGAVAVTSFLLAKYLVL